MTHQQKRYCGECDHFGERETDDGKWRGCKKSKVQHDGVCEITIGCDKWKEAEG